MDRNHIIMERYFPEEELTRYGFISEMESYIKQLLNNPMSARVSDRLKSFGIDEVTALKMLLKRENPADENSAILIRTERIRPEEQSEEDKMNGIVPKDKFYVKYKLPRKDYLKKMRNLYFNTFENGILKENINSNDDVYEIEFDNGIIGECDGGDGIGGGATTADASGQYVTPMTTKPLKRKTIYFTESQIEKIRKSLNEDSPAVTNTQFGDFGYDAPVFAKKGDPTLDHKNIMKKSFEEGQK